MNLKEAVLKEYSKANSARIVKYVGQSPSKFSTLVEVFLSGPYRVTQRVAWPMSVCIEHNPQLVKPHLRMLLYCLKQRNIHDAVKRNILRLLQFVEIPKHLQGTTSEICFQFFRNKKEPIAVRVFSMTVLSNLAKKLPELKNELVPLIEDQMPYGSAGFVSRGRKLLKELKSNLQ